MNKRSYALDSEGGNNAKGKVMLVLNMIIASEELDKYTYLSIFVGIRAIVIATFL